MQFAVRTAALLATPVYTDGSYSVQQLSSSVKNEFFFFPPHIFNTRLTSGSEEEKKKIHLDDDQ